MLQKAQVRTNGGIDNLTCLIKDELWQPALLRSEGHYQIVKYPFSCS